MNIRKRVTDLEAQLAGRQRPHWKEGPPLSHEERVARVMAFFEPVADRWREASERRGRDRGKLPTTLDLVCAGDRGASDAGLTDSRFHDRETGAYICDGRHVRMLQLLESVAERRAFGDDGRRA